MTRQNQVLFDNMHRRQAETRFTSCALRSNLINAENFLLQALCALISLIIVSIFGIIIT